jgi:hypothetical protein
MVVTYLVEMFPSLRSGSPYGPERGVTLRKIQIFSPISSLNEKGFRLAINLMPMRGYLKIKKIPELQHLLLLSSLALKIRLYFSVNL